MSREKMPHNIALASGQCRAGDIKGYIIDAVDRLREKGEEVNSKNVLAMLKILRETGLIFTCTSCFSSYSLETGEMSLRSGSGCTTGEVLSEYKAPQIPPQVS